MDGCADVNEPNAAADFVVVEDHSDWHSQRSKIDVDA